MRAACDARHARGGVRGHQRVAGAVSSCACMILSSPGAAPPELAERAERQLAAEHAPVELHGLAGVARETDIGVGREVT